MEEEVLLPNLPNEIAIQCIARVPRSFHPNLSLVCKSWRSLLGSPLFFSTRSHLKCTQPFLYFRIFFHDFTSKWYVLDQCDGNPRKISPLPLIPSPTLNTSACALGPRLFVLGGSVNNIPSSNVWVFDARTNSWEAGPKMTVGRRGPTVAVVNGKIYVVGNVLNNSTFDSWVKAECGCLCIALWMVVGSKRNT
ncbi:F-box/kelch-repeat protein At5g39560-like [Tasmannia lanceolata]|uniref:F-box/kelch-repeat protein At5g39560-like n=1 Tax=Tasmannia lanceolata TaxID=3420 RepID=UPI004063A008